MDVSMGVSVDWPLSVLCVFVCVYVCVCVCVCLCVCAFSNQSKKPHNVSDLIMYHIIYQRLDRI